MAHKNIAVTVYAFLTIEDREKADTLGKAIQMATLPSKKAKSIGTVYEKPHRLGRFINQGDEKYRFINYYLGANEMAPATYLEPAMEEAGAYRNEFDEFYDKSGHRLFF